jgi:hypothetical protein
MIEIARMMVSLSETNNKQQTTTIGCGSFDNGERVVRTHIRVDQTSRSCAHHRTVLLTLYLVVARTLRIEENLILYTKIS